MRGYAQGFQIVTSSNETPHWKKKQYSNNIIQEYNKW